jgi:hypothetical protein
MLHSDFVAHLARKGALRDPQALDSSLRDRRGDPRGDLDWAIITLT